jgi:filamentous hemagglutinin
LQEQSALRAGDGGFQVNVAGNTDFKGAVISSTASGAAASSLVTGSLTHSDIENYSKMSAASIGVGGSATQSGTGSRDALGTGQGIGSTKPMDLGETRSGGGISGVAATSNNETSTTRSGVGAAAIVITNDTAQQAATGQSAEAVLAGLNRNTVTGTDTSDRLGNSLDVQAVRADLEITSAFGSSVGTLLAAKAAQTVGDIGDAHRKEAEAAERDYTRLADQAASNGDASEAARYSELALEQKNTAADWGDNGVNRLALHASAQGLIGGLAGGSAGATASVSGVVGGNLGQQLGQYLGTERANALGLTDGDRAALINSYQKDMAKVGGMVAGLTSADMGGAMGSGALAGTLQGGGTATTVDSYNRQLHQTEAQKLELLKAGKSATEKHRLDAAACALVKCSDGVPTNDPLYANLRALQIEGNRYSAELQMLKNTGEFNYSRWSDKYGDWVTSQNEALRRIGGAGNLVMGSFGTVTGGMMAGAGAAACPVSLGAGCGVALLGTGIVGLSAKQAYDGNAALWGPYASTEGARVIASFSTSTYPGEATPIRDAVIETGKFGSLAVGGKLIPKGISAIEEQIAKIKQTSTTVPANSARPQIVGDEPFSPNGMSDGSMVHPVLTSTVSDETLSSLLKQISQIRATLPSGAKTGGNMGVAQIDIVGLPTTIAASSRIDNPTASQLSAGLIGKSTDIFESSKVPTAAGFMVDRALDSEAKILNNIALRIGENKSITGTITLLTEREPCVSCSAIIEKFREKYPNIKLSILHNNNVVIKPFKKE